MDRRDFIRASGALAAASLARPALAQGALDVELQRAGDKKPFCFPSPTPTRAATLSEFVNWVRALPEHARLGAAPGLVQFLRERFPCK